MSEFTGTQAVVPAPADSDAAATGARPVRLQRIGLVLAFLLGLADIGVGIAQSGDGATFPIELSIAIIAAGVVTLGALPFAWRGAGWAIWLIVVVRMLSALTALPAFWEADVPVDLVITAAAIIVVTVLTAVLLLVPVRRSA